MIDFGKDAPGIASLSRYPTGALGTAPIAENRKVGETSGTVPQGTSSLVIGIDPGLSGAFAALDAATGVLVALEDLPVIRSGRLGWIDAAELLPKLRELNGHGATTAIVERQGAMPRQGVASSFTIGVTFGSLLAALQAAALPVELVTAVQWKRALGLLKSDKRASLDRARLLFPTASLDRQKDHGRAEALLIAWWRLHRARATAEQRGADRP